jgi:hypothetical protein
MADTHSVDSNELSNVSLGEHITQLINAIDANNKLAKVIYEARGGNTLKPGKKIKLEDGREVGMDDLKAYNTRIKAALKAIPKIVSNEKKAEKKRKSRSSRNLTAEPKPHTPSQFSGELVAFFNSADLGKSEDGATTLQKQADMQPFFQSGVGSPAFGVSLFNVWGNTQKLKHNSTEIVLDAASQRALAGSLTALKDKKRAIISSADLQSVDADVRAEAEKKRDTATADLERLNANKIHNKDYMSILNFYRITNNPNDLSPFAEAVNGMCKITKDLNAKYGGEIKTQRETRESAAKPVKVVAAPAPVAAPVPSLPSLKAAPALPTTIPTVARGASPVGKRR